MAYVPETGDLLSVTPPVGGAVTMEYDAGVAPTLGRGWVTKVTDALNRSTRTIYDQLGRPTQVQGPDGTTTVIDYNRSSQRTAVRDALGNGTGYQYDRYGRVTTVSGVSGTALYTYDLMSNLTSLTDAKGQKTTFEYDTHDRVKKMIYPTAPGQTAKFEEFAYNVRGLLQTMTDRKGIVTTFAYDDLGRLIDKSFALPIGSSDAITPPVHYSYDAVGRMLTAANGSDALTWTYDQAGDVITEQSSENATTVAYAYDAAGNRASISLNGTLHLTYGYDDGSRLTTITKGSAVFGFGYDVLSRRSSMTYPNGVATAYGYEPLSGRLSTIAATVTATGAPITAFSYAHDLVGNRTQKASLESTETYSYDRQYRLTKADRVGVGAVASTYSAWAYDDAGNRTASQSESSVTKASYNEKNQLTETTAGGPMLWRGVLSEPAVVTVTSANTTDQPARLLPGNVFEADLTLPLGPNTVSVKARDGSGNQTTNDYSINVTGDRAEFTYDVNGNLTRKIEAPGTGEQVVWTYSWNAMNQLIEVKKGATPGAVVSVAAFVYDPVGRRTEKTASSSTTKWAYDGMHILRETVTGVGAGTFSYVHGAGIDEALARTNQATSAFEYYHADGLGSVVGVTDIAGTVVLSYRYDAWGNIEVGTGRGGFAFTGREWDPETGLYYDRARYYDPKAGRFVNEDPIGFGGGMNSYSYVANRPTNSSDPFGLRDDATPWQVGVEWLTGTGPINHSFTDGDPFAEQLRQSRHIQALIKAACAGTVGKSGRFNNELSGLKGVPKYLGDYSTLLTNGATGNLAATYLGSYELGYSISGGTLTMDITNYSSFQSATHPPVVGYTKLWKDYIGDPADKFMDWLGQKLGQPIMSRTRQTFSLHENISACACKP